MREKICPACGHNRFTETSWQQAKQEGVRIIKERHGNWVADYDESTDWETTGVTTYSVLECMRCGNKFDHQDFLMNDDCSNHLCGETCLGIKNCPLEAGECDYGNMLLIERAEFYADERKEQEVVNG